MFMVGTDINVIILVTKLRQLIIHGCKQYSLCRNADRNTCIFQSQKSALGYNII